MPGQSKILECLNNGTVFVTPNKRLVAFLTQRLSDEIAAQQPTATACVLPKIISYEDFVDESVLGQSMVGNLPLREKIHSTAEQWLWESIIREDEVFASSAHPLLSYPTLAREAQSAFRLFTEWLVDFEQTRFQFIAQLESERLEYWFEEYLRRTEQLNVCNAAQQQAALFYGRYANAIGDFSTSSRPEEKPSRGAAASLESHSGQGGSIAFDFTSDPALDDQFDLAIDGENGLCLYGFQALNPIQQACFTAYAEAQRETLGLVHLDVNDLRRTDASPTDAKQWLHYQATDLEDEFRQACRWARTEQQQNPNGRFAVVVPQLVSHRALLERLLHEAFFANGADETIAPHQAGLESDPTNDRAVSQPSLDSTLHSDSQVKQPVSDRYNLSSGRPLATVPMVRHWLLLLRGVQSALTLEECAEVLLSPYFCSADIDYQRALQCAFANTRQSELKIADWLAALDWDNARSERRKLSGTEPDAENEEAAERCEFAKALRKLTEFLRRQRHVLNSRAKKRTIAEWMIFIDELIQFLAWPMASSHNSDEYQQYQMFQQCLREVSNYSNFIGPLSFANAVGFIERFLSAYSYQRQTIRPKAREIPEFLGVLEACGQEFDAIWLCQMSDQEWPVRNRVNPLLPYALQAEQAFPGSTAREHRYAQALSSQLCSAAGRVVVSHCRDVDETPLRLSSYILDEIATEPLLDYKPRARMGGIHEVNYKGNHKGNHEAKHAANSADAWKGGLEVFIDDCGQALADGDKLLSHGVLSDSSIAMSDTAEAPLKIRNGVSALTDYAQLPFLAYLRHRLELSPIRTPYSGLPPQERGTLIHDVLESLWRTTTHQQQLLAISQSDLVGLVDQHVDEELMRVNSTLFQALAPLQIEIEKQAIKAMLLAWVAFEKERQAFSVVATELPVRYCYSNYYVEGRIDRVDWVENTGLQLLDYKTGFSQTKDWFDDQVSSPQLPLYALSLDSGTVGASALSERCEKRLGDSAFVEGEQVQALAFASLRVGALGLAGYFSEEASTRNQLSQDSDSQSTPEKTNSSVGQSRKEAMGMKSIVELGDDRFSTWLEARRTWATSIENCFDALLSGHADMLHTVDASDSPYQAILRSGFVYNELSSIAIRLPAFGGQPLSLATEGSNDAE